MDESVRYRGRLAPLAVARGPRPRARRLRSDLEHSAAVDPGDASPAGTHVCDIEARDADGKSVHFALRRHLGSATIDEAHVRARPAHVQRDEVGVGQKLRDAHGSDDAGGRTGVQHLDRSCASALARENPARRLHDEQGRFAAPRVELPLEVPHVARDERGQVRGHDRRGCALVLAKGRENVRRECDLERGIPLLHELPQAPLVLRALVGVEQADGERLRIFRFHEAVEGLEETPLVQGNDHLTSDAHALRRFDGAPQGHEGLGLAADDGVHVRARLSLQDEDVLESPGSHECRAAALALEDGIGRNGRAVEEAPQPGELVPEAFVGSLDDRERRIGRRRRHLVRAYPPCAVRPDEVGERPAHLGCELDQSCLRRRQSAMPPPSTTTAAPVMNEESSVERKSTARAISSAVPMRPIGRLLAPFR